VHGNVWEWVADCYVGDAYKAHRIYPEMVGNWQDSCVRALRGGSWYDLPKFLRSASRYWQKSDYRNSKIGFRVARTL